MRISRNFQFAKHNMLLLKHRQPGLGRGFLAGSPNFLSYFGRDSFWSLKANAENYIEKNQKRNKLRYHWCPHCSHYHITKKNYQETNNQPKK